MNVGEKCPDIVYEDHAGKEVRLDSVFKSKGLAVFFLSTNCPYVSSQKERLIALHERYHREGLGFIAVYSNNDLRLSPDNTRKNTFARHAESGYPFSCIYDQHQAIARTFDVACTPETFLFDTEGALVYQGRVDDSWRDPAGVKHEYLRNAIDAVLRGEKVEQPFVPAFGCAIKWNAVKEDLTVVRLSTSAFLRRIRHTPEIHLIHLLNGVSMELNSDTLDFLMAFKRHTTLTEVARRFSLPAGIGETVRELVEAQYLVPEGCDELAAHRERVERRRRRLDSGGLLSILRMNIATGCNLRCTYCYMEKSPVDRAKKEHSKAMSWEVARSAVDEFLENASTNGRRYITIRYIGGEPLLNRRVLMKTMRRVEERSRELGIEANHLLCTNGILVDTSFARFFGQLGKSHALVSLDGLAHDNDRMRIKPNGSGSYKDVVGAIRILQEEGVSVSVPAVVNRANFRGLKPFLAEMAAMGVRQVGLNPEYRFGETSLSEGEAIEITEALLACRIFARQLGITLTGKAFLPEWHVRNGNIANCEAMGRAVVVDPDGSLSICDKLPEHAFKVGQLGGFVRSARYRDFAMRVRGNIEACDACEARWMCNGGCAAEIAIASGSIGGVAGNCGFIRTIARETFEVLE